MYFFSPQNFLKIYIKVSQCNRKRKVVVAVLERNATSYKLPSVTLLLRFLQKITDGVVKLSKIIKVSQKVSHLIEVITL